MNKQQRRVITKVIYSLEEMLDTVQTALDEEGTAWDKLLEEARTGERGKVIIATEEDLENAVEALGDVHSRLASAIGR